MFLFERAFGVGVYIAILLFVCFLLTKTNLPCKPILRFYIICLCVMAFFYKPYVTADLYRVYEMMDYFAEMDFLYFWENFVLDSSVPVARLLYWCIGKTGINALLPVLSTFACYSFLFYIIEKTQELFSISKQNVAYVLFFVMTTSMYISVIGGIRMMLSLSMIAFSYFRGTVEKKVRLFDVLLFALSGFIHTMSFVVIGICVIVILFDSGKPFVRKIAVSLIVGLVGIVFMSNFSEIADGLYQKFFDYIIGDRYSDPWEYLMGSIIILLLLVLVWEFHRIPRREDCVGLKSCNAATVWCVLIAMCFFFEFSTFYRFGGQLAVIFSIPMMMTTLEKTRGNPSRILPVTDFRSMFLLLSAVIALISCARGSLSSLKFFEL